MASEYWKWKFKDVQPEEKRELTPEEKRRNWWDYHKWHVVLGAVLLGVLGNIVWGMTHRTEPDCQVAYVGTEPLPDETAAALEAAFAVLAEDLNGDGRTIVQVRQYAFRGDMQSDMAAQTALMADLMEGESYLFLLEDPEGFQQGYQSLARTDGSLPEETDGTFSGEGTCLAWEQCPVLAAMDLGEYSCSQIGGTVTGSSGEVVSRLFLARRGFWKEEDAAYPEGWAALWDRLTEGAEA